MKKPLQLSSEITNLLMPRLNDEYNAFYHYRAASHWCAGVGFMKAASFFAKESESELSHAAIIEKFLVDWNVIVAVPPIPSPQIEYQSLLDVIEKSYNIELDLYTAYEETSVAVFAKGDICAFDLLQPLRQIQTESVAEYSDMLNMLEGTKADKFQLLLLEDKLFS